MSTNGGSSPSSGDSGGWWSRMSRSEQVAAAIGGAVVAGIFAVVIALIGHSTGSPQPGPSDTGTHVSTEPSRPSPASPSIVSSPTPVSGVTVVTYTVDPRQWQPAPVPGLTLVSGDVVSITANSGQWSCADVTGYTGIQGSPDYHAVNHAWAVPSAPFCSLIGKVGVGRWQQLTPDFQLVAGNSGQLELTTNELMPDHCPQGPDPRSCYTDNKGAITVQITVSRSS